MKITDGAKALLIDNPYVGQITEVRAAQTGATDSRSGAEADYQPSADALWLDQVQSAMAETDEVDMDKVQTIRQSLADGQLDLDLTTLSQAILEMHRN